MSSCFQQEFQDIYKMKTTTKRIYKDASEKDGY